MKQGNKVIPAGNYPLSGITSYTMVTQDPPTGCATALLWFGVLALIGGAVEVLGPAANVPPVGIGVAFVMIAGGWAWKRSMKPFYWIVIRTAGTEIRAFGTESLTDAQSIVDAIGDAIDAR